MTRTAQIASLFAAVILSVGFFALPSCSKQAINNHVQVTEFSIDTVKQMGPDGHMTLNLRGITAGKDIDNVQVYLRCEVPQPGTTEPFQALNHVDEVVIGSQVGTIKDLTFDITGQMKSLLDFNPSYVKGMEVMFVVTPKNRNVTLDDNSFTVKETFFAVFGKDGKPLAVKKPKA